MAIIQDNIKSEVQDFLKDMRDPVTLDFYPQPGSPATDPMQQLLAELHDMAPQIEVVHHEEAASPVGPERPGDVEGPVTTVSRSGTFTGIRYLGFPGGQEFGAFLQDLVDVSADRDVTLSPETQEWLKNLQEPLHLEVFVTPT